MGVPLAEDPHQVAPAPGSGSYIDEFPDGQDLLNNLGREGWESTAPAGGPTLRAIA